jgi:hypothetical protein
MPNSAKLSGKGLSASGLHYESMSAGSNAAVGDKKLKRGIRRVAPRHWAYARTAMGLTARQGGSDNADTSHM